jgi:hypothetical protein
MITVWPTKTEAECYIADLQYQLPAWDRYREEPDRLHVWISVPDIPKRPEIYRNQRNESFACLTDSSTEVIQAVIEKDAQAAGSVLYELQHCNRKLIMRCELTRAVLLDGDGELLIFGREDRNGVWSAHLTPELIGV